MERQEYINRVAEHLRALLDAETQLPCKFVISGGWTSQSDGPISVYLDTASPWDGIFEGGKLFAKIQDRLNAEFADDEWYFGIGIGVPHRFLGRKHMDDIQSQEEDNARYRRVRLNETENRHRG